MDAAELIAEAIQAKEDVDTGKVDEALDAARVKVAAVPTTVAEIRAREPRSALL